MQDTMNLNLIASPLKRTIRLGHFFFSRDPAPTTLIISFGLFASLLESFGLMSLLPLFSLVVNQGSEAPSSPLSESASKVEQAITDLFAFFGLEPGIGILLTTIVLALTLKSAFNMLGTACIGIFIARLSMRLRFELLQSIWKARWLHFLRFPTGRFTNALTIESHRAASSYNALCILVSQLIQALVFIGATLYLDPYFALGAGIVGIVIVILFRRTLSISQHAGDKTAASFNALMSYLTDTLHGLKPIKAMARGAPIEARIAKETHQLRRARERIAIVVSVLKFSPEPIMAVIIAIGFYVAVTKLSLDLATMAVMAMLFIRIFSRFTGIQRQLNSVVQKDAFLWSLRKLIDDTKAAAEATQGSRKVRLTSEIAVRDLCFSYDVQLVLKGVSLELPAGSFSVIAGPSGSGKSTFADLIMGLLHPTSGEIVVDGVPLTEADMGLWRQNIGYVSQDLFLFHDSIRHNVTLSEPDISDEAVELALRRAGAWEFVSALPQGIDSVIGERGLRLSGGQRQRIAIARAVVKSPDLLVLDEPTTALDPKTEEHICATLRDLAGDGLTILAISHQPTITKVADQVYHLETGTLLPQEIASLAPHQGPSATTTKATAEAEQRELESVPYAASRRRPANG